MRKNIKRGLMINGTAKGSVFDGNTMPSGIDIDKIDLLHNGI